MEIKINSIGIVNNNVELAKHSNWNDEISIIQLDNKYIDGLKGIEQFKYLIIIYYLDKASFNIDKHLVRRPRGRDDMPELGIFAQRTKDHPNTIGITSVELVEVSNNKLYVKGLDALNNTMILDIKPYFTHYDKRECDNPKWVDELMKDYF